MMVLPVRYRSIHLSAAPPRRVVAHTSPPPRIRIRRPPAPSVARTVSAPTPPRASEQDRFNAPRYTLKAFAIATAVVMSSATASVAAVMACLDVRNTEEFAARMRTWVSHSMPLLTAKIYRRPTSHDGDPVLFAASTPPHESSTPTVFDHDAAQQRLAEVFDNGGFDAWAEAVARDMEAEIEVERSQRSRTT